MTHPPPVTQWIEAVEVMLRTLNSIQIHESSKRTLVRQGLVRLLARMKKARPR